MLRYEDCGSEVDSNGVVDPDLIDDLQVKTSFTAELGPLWPYVHALNSDARKIERNHEMRKVALARYGRQSLMQWDDVDVAEIRRWYELLVELVREEGGSPSEDG